MSTAAPTGLRGAQALQGSVTWARRLFCRDFQMAAILQVKGGCRQVLNFQMLNYRWKEIKDELLCVISKQVYQYTAKNVGILTNLLTELFNATVVSGTALVSFVYLPI